MLRDSKPGMANVHQSLVLEIRGSGQKKGGDLNCVQFIVGSYNYSNNQTDLCMLKNTAICNQVKVSFSFSY